MPQPLAFIRSALRRFRRNRGGSAAVEFALVAPIFFGLLFAIMEVALMFFASQVLEKVTQDAARMIMTGQAQNLTYTKQDFKKHVCDPTALANVLFDCENGLYIDVQNYPAFGEVSIKNPIEAGTFVNDMKLLSRQGRRNRRGANVLSVAALCHRARLQHRQSGRQQAALDRYGGVQERTLSLCSSPLFVSRAMKMNLMSSIWLRAKRSTAAFVADCRAVAAVELAVIAPVMLLMFFATVEFSNGVAIDRKVTLVAHTLSDLTSRSTTVTDAELTNFFTAGTGIMYPYPASPISSTISELYVEPATLVARVQWSSGAAPRAAKSTMTIPAALKVAGSYLIYSEVSYVFTPAVPWILQGGITLSDYAYTRPRQSACVTYSPMLTDCTAPL